MQIGDTVKITGEDGSYVEIGKDDGYPNGIFVGTREGAGFPISEVSLSRDEADLLILALASVVA